MNIPTTNDLKESLRRFLEVHTRGKILSAENGQLEMYVKLAQSQASKPRDKMIVYFLLRIKERLLEQTPDDKTRVVCEFLISELNGYYKELKQ
ncbi:MAG: hypothetical protein JNM27_04310 [Leptospirales bacterium]|nr:hypothetical protein [Leptospirales bacterium]